MEVVYASEKLAKQCASDKSRARAFGTQRADKLKSRIGAMLAADSMDDLRYAPGRYENLSADRKGQLSTRLDGAFRLVFEPVLSEHQDLSELLGNWHLITKLRIVEIVDYHGR